MNDHVDQSRLLQTGSLEDTPDARPRHARRRGLGRLVVRAGVLALIAAAGLWAYHSNVASGRPAMNMSTRLATGDTPFPVTLGPVERGRVTGSVTYTGSVAPFTEEDVYPRVTGRIVEMPVYPGDAVRPGQVVARLDDVELGSRVREAAAAVAAAQANVAQMEADVLAAHHGVAQMDRELEMVEADIAAARDGVTQMEKELAMAQAEGEYQESLRAREERLFASGAVSRQDVESARAMAAATRAKVQAAQAKVAQARSMVASAQARADAARAKAEQAKAMEASALRKRDAMAAMVTQSQAQLGTAQVVRNYVTIAAPNGGYVVKRLVAPGVLVQPGMAILKIAQVDRVRLQANVGEKDLPSIRVGTPVTVTTTRNGQPLLTARVTSVFPFVEQGPRTAVVEAVVENADRRLLPGQYVTMQFVIGEHADALSVPRGAVSRLGDKAFVWVVADGRAESRVVTTGLGNPDRVEISDGLGGDERIVVRGHEGLYTGARVTEASASTHGGPDAGKQDARRPGTAPMATGTPAGTKENAHGAGH